MDVNPAGLTILAETALPLAELDGPRLDAEIKDASEDLASVSGDEARRKAQEKLDQLRELKAAVSL